MKKTFLFLLMAVAMTGVSCGGDPSDSEGFIDYVPIQPDPTGRHGGNRGWALANLDGDVIELPESFSVVSASVNGIFSATETGGRSFCFYTAEATPKRIGGEYERVGAFTGKYAPVLNMDGTFQYIDREGKVAFDVVAHNVGNFFCGRALIMASGLYGYIDETGEQVIPAEYVKAERFNEGYAVVWKSDDEWAVIDTNGKKVLGDKREHSRPNRELFANWELVREGWLIAAMPDGKNYIFCNVKEPAKSIQRDWADKTPIYSYMHEGECLMKWGLYNPKTMGSRSCDLSTGGLVQFNDVATDFQIWDVFTPDVKGYGKKVVASQNDQMYLVTPSGSKTEAPIFNSEPGDISSIYGLVMDNL